MKKTINIQINKSVLKELESYSEELNKTKESLIEEAIIAYFNKLDEELSDKRIHDCWDAWTWPPKRINTWPVEELKSILIKLYHKWPNVL